MWKHKPLIGNNMKNSDEKYFAALSKEYPTIQSLCHEIIHLRAILNLPKGTEHYISDLHGEYEAFLHLMNNCSGVIKEKALVVFGDELTKKEIDELCYLIYYPHEILKSYRDKQWYQQNILRLIRLARYVTSKYSRLQVRENINNEYGLIIDELIHAQLDEMDQQYIYHMQVIDSIIELDEQDEFIKNLCDLIKYFAIAKLHVLGDIFDRGKEPDKIIDDLIKYQRVDIQWGNHDALWMGAALGQEACMITVIKNCIHYDNVHLLEKRYSIPLRKLALLSLQAYPQDDEQKAMEKYCLNLQIKLESKLITDYPEWHMSYRLVKHDYGCLSEDEKELINDLKESFTTSLQLQRHIRFLFENGSLYLRTNHNLLLHGCIPLTEEGEFYQYTCFGRKLKGKAYFDVVNDHVALAFEEHDQEAIDYLWYLWCGDKSPLCGRKIVLDKPCEELQDPYYQWIEKEETCLKILKAFHLYEPECMIINGHTPVRVKEGESPIKGNGRLVVIDGGFCRLNQRKTGVAGYTLISNSHGMRLKTHQIHLGSYAIHHDVQYDNQIIYTRKQQEMMKDTKQGEIIQDKIDDLTSLLYQRKQKL